MNKKLLLIAPVVVFGLNEPFVVEAQTNCVIPSIPANCQAAPQITVNRNSMNVSPPNICASPGQTIPVQVRPMGETAEVVSKGGAGWLSGNGGEFEIYVPDDASGDFDYAIYFPDGSCIDPRISVD